MSAALDVQKLILPATPPQWPELPRPVRDALVAGGGTLWHHSACAQRLGPGGSLVYACASACPVRLAEEALRKRNFLIVNDAVPGYKPICGRCGRKHRYLTQMCIEVPFNGLTEVIAKFKEPTIATNGDQITECLRLGALVPITAAEALLLKTRIRQRGGHIK